MLPFEITHRDPSTSARAGELETPHGTVRTPAFMPVGTGGTVKGMASWELERLQPEMVLANTYHLLLRPGVDRIERLGGLHRLMAFNGPILTDSGGYQVFSLASRRILDDDGVSACFDVDVAMVLDECLPYPVEREEAEQSVARSVSWAVEGLGQAERSRDGSWRGGLFAIQQGSLSEGLRRRCSDELSEHPFDGFAVGGLAVGEDSQRLYEAVEMATPLLPSDRPRYLMGVGYPEDMLHAVACGVDLFDCVLPTRSARTGKVFTSNGDLNIKNARHADDDRTLDECCDCPTCGAYSRAALRHLFVAGEVTSVVLLTVHNLTYFVSLMRAAREAIMAGRYPPLRSRLESARTTTAP
jgi:queuine tRNA-ribosyltransferase